MSTGEFLGLAAFIAGVAAIAYFMLRKRKPKPPEPVTNVTTKEEYDRQRNGGRTP